jgi:hypothetical protein
MSIRFIHHEKDTKPCAKYRDGYKIKELAGEFFLSIDSIKKIVYIRTS